VSRNFSLISQLLLDPFQVFRKKSILVGNGGNFPQLRLSCPIKRHGYYSVADPDSLIQYPDPDPEFLQNLDPDPESDPDS
jgi:hypothetical protein